MSESHTNDLGYVEQGEHAIEQGEHAIEQGEHCFDEQYMEELRKLLGVQYYFLSRTYVRTGELPQQSLNGSSAEVEALLGEVFSNPLEDHEREGALCSLEVFFTAVQELCIELEEFPRFDDVWERYEGLILTEAGEDSVEDDEELAS